MSGDIEIRFIERERFDQRGEAMKNSANHGGFAPINIEARRQNDEFRTTLQRHESRHGRAHAKFARFVIARRQHAATIARAANADRLAAQFRAIAHLDRGIKAIHVEMDDRPSVRLDLHKANLARTGDYFQPAESAAVTRG